jgi:translation elongation factor EF-G
LNQKLKLTKKKWVLLSRLVAEDPSLKVHLDEESGQTVLVVWASSFRNYS